MHLGKYIRLVHTYEVDLANALHKVAKEHGDEPDVFQTCQLMARWSEKLIEEIVPFVEKYRKEKDEEPDKLTRILFEKKRKGPTALLRDLQDLYVLASELGVCSIILRQAALALRDDELIQMCDRVAHKIQRQQSWLLTRMKQTAPQSLIAAE